jgi:hypothetical protein
MSQAKRVQFPRELLVPEAAVSSSLGPITYNRVRVTASISEGWGCSGRSTDA